ncbi:MAG TPA: hypothetical protein VJT81_09895 [Burkholderiales bacterium]|nr:hypothetical protein [Burkholderiales bacterium]
MKSILVAFLLIALRWLAIILGIAALGSLLYGVGEVTQSDSDREWAQICHWSFDDLYKYHRIGRTVGPGGYAADIWKSIYVEKSERGAINRLNAAREVYGEKIYLEIREAIADNFRLSEILSEDLEADINLVVNIAINSCEDLKRRTALIERIKDMLMYVGLTTILALVASFLTYIGYTIESKMYP